MADSREGGTVAEAMEEGGAVEDGAVEDGAVEDGAVDLGQEDGASQDPAVAGLGYEQARDELVEVVRRLEAGGEPLEESLALWERGEALAARCQEWLDGARVRLEAARAGSSQPAGQR